MDRDIKFGIGAAVGVIAVCATAMATTVGTGELVVNGGAESGLSGWSYTSSIQADTGTFDSGYGPHSGSRQFVGGHNAGQASISQSITMPISASDRLRGATYYLSNWERSYQQDAGQDIAYTVLHFFDSQGNVITSDSTSGIGNYTSNWTYHSVSGTVPSNAAAMQLVGFFIRYAGNDLDAFLDDISLSLAYTPNMAPTTGAGNGIDNRTVNIGTVSQFAESFADSDGYVVSVNMVEAAPSWMSAVWIGSQINVRLSPNTTDRGEYAFHFQITDNERATTTLTLNISVVPEPATLSIVGGAIGTLLLRRPRRAGNGFL